MKKILLAIALVIALILSAMPAVLAEARTETEEEESLGGWLHSLFGEGGKLSGLVEEGGLVDELLQNDKIAGLLPEGIDPQSMMESLREQINDENSELYQAANRLYDFVTNEDGSLNEEALMQLASGLFAGGDGEGNESAMEDMAQQATAMTNYVKAMNADTLEAGDAQVVTLMASSVIPQADGSGKVLGYFPQTNYALDGKDLKSIAYAANSILFTLAKNDSGVWEVTEAKMAEDGEGYADSLAALCAEVDMTTDDFYGLLAFQEMYDLSGLQDAMAQVPEAERVGYGDEMLTAEEVKQRFDDLISALMAQMGGGAGEEAPAQ